MWPMDLLFLLFSSVFALFLLNTKEGLQPPKNHYMNLDPPTDIIIFRQNYNISKQISKK